MIIHRYQHSMNVLHMRCLKGSIFSKQNGKTLPQVHIFANQAFKRGTEQMVNPWLRKKEVHCANKKGMLNGVHFPKRL